MPDECRAASAAEVSSQVDRPRHECGVFGAWAPGQDVARLIYFGLFTLQHRGQESAGIAVSNGHEIYGHKQMGLVNQIFDEERLSKLRGDHGIGHVRYSTTGSSMVRNAQPFLTREGDIAVAHNGNLVNANALRKRLEASGATLEGNSDTELIATLLSRQLASATPLEDAVRGLASQIKGAYSLLFCTETELVACRDPHGLHPLCIGRLGDESYVLASETCALSAVGAKLMREIEPGEACLIDADGLRFFEAAPSPRSALCIFETIYFARPDSIIFGRSLHEARRHMGEQLAQEHPVEGDVVIGVPDTGTPGAVGYANAAHIRFDVGLVKNRYIARTFIQPNQHLRDLGAQLKYTPLRSTLEGRRVIAVDDSIVRGTTTARLVTMLREAGAAEVHLRICSPPIKWPCFYGIDMATREQLIASSHSIKKIQQMIGADSLGYLSLTGLTKALGVDRNKFCRACLTGRYPIAVPPEERAVVGKSCATLDEPEAPRALGEPVLMALNGLFDGAFDDPNDYSM